MATLRIDVLLDYSLPAPADLLIQVEAAAMADQRVSDDVLTVTSAEALRAVPGEESIGQRTWALGEGRVRIDYRATVAIARATVALEGLEASPPRDLPGLVVPYLMPSRYCESDRFEAFAEREFGRLAGGDKVAAMRDWIRTNLDYVRGSSSGATTAADSFVQRQGVCRDFAHLLATFARAAGVPARLVSCYAPGVKPRDFHAVVEVWLAGSWHLVDATGMAKPGEIARVAVGRDATDIAFMTIFGSAEMIAQRVVVTRAG